MTWVAYSLSLAVGLGVGMLYGFINVRSPAPPVIALLGLLGMIAGESIVSWFRGHPEAVSHLLHSKNFTLTQQGTDKDTEHQDRG